MLKISLMAGPEEKKDEKQRKNQVEVEVVRTKITLACTECKQRNYNMTKDKKTHPDRMETKKYCRFCKLILYTKKPSKECELWEKLQALRRLRRRAFSRV